MIPNNLLILGNGGAASNAIMAARAGGYTGTTHQVSDIDEPAFNPMLSPYYLKGITSWENCFPFGPDFYEKHDVTRHFGSPVVSLDAAEKNGVPGKRSDSDL